MNWFNKNKQAIELIDTKLKYYSNIIVSIFIHTFFCFLSPFIYYLLIIDVCVKKLSIKTQDLNTNIFILLTIFIICLILSTLTYTIYFSFYKRFNHNSEKMLRALYLWFNYITVVIFVLVLSMKDYIVDSVVFNYYSNANYSLETKKLSVIIFISLIQCSFLSMNFVLKNYLENKHYKNKENR